MMMQFGGPGMTDDTMGMMQRMHGSMMGGGITGGMGPIGGMGPMGLGLMQMFDADGDTTATPEEMGAQLQAKLTEYDSDGDGTLSIAEFETLHSAMFRETMVDRFQYLDADGDGAVTAEEMTAPAKKMRLIQNMFEMRFGDGQTPGGNTPRMGNGSMMNEN
jgi:Ca2+-binding EF-hand superfamily protein